MTSINFSLTGRSIAVTGGASGIGRAVSHGLATQGAKVGIIDLDADAAQAAAAAINAAGGTALAVTADVRSPDEMGTALSTIESELGKISGAVASAGISRPRLAADMTQQEWNDVIDINLTGVFTTAQSAGRRLIANGGGSLVVISSVVGLGGLAERAHYSASKFGVNGVVRTLAIEWGRQGVRVNAVAPGTVDTPLFRSLHTQESLEKNMLNRIPLGRLSEARDQADAVLYLLSDASSYVTGAVLPVDGGLTAGNFTNITN